jgi:hypothetical protein
VSVLTSSSRASVLELEVERMRLLLRRRILWLRAWWGNDPLHGAAGLLVSDARADAHARGERRRDEQAFYRDDAEAAAIGEVLAELTAELESQENREPEALDVITARLGLDELERAVLVLATAPELDDGIGRLCAYAQDDAARRYATTALAADLLGPEVTSRLAPQRPLRRLRLVVLDTGERSGWSGRALRVDERVLLHLTGGAGAPDPRLLDLFEPVHELPPRGAAAALAERLAALLPERGWPAVHLRGPAHAGAEALAADVAARFGLRLVALRADRLTALLEDVELQALLAREALLAGLAVFIPHVGGAAAGELALRVEAPVFVGGPDRLEPQASALVVPLETPTRPEQRELWAAALGGDDAEVIAPLVEQFDFGPREIRDAVAAAGARADLHGEAPAFEHLWEAARERARLDADGLARRIPTACSWGQLVLPDDALAQLEEIAAQAKLRTKVYDDWGFATTLTRGRAITALFAGASGTGKTMAAEAIADRLRLDLHRVDLAAVVSKYIGETEKNLRAVFDAAERSGAVLFFDEADALFGKRTDVKDAHDRYANIEVDYLLQRMEDYGGGVAILATNRRWLLDHAFLRRLRFVVEFPFPDRDARLRMWQGVFPDGVPRDDLDLEALSRLEVAGGSIRTIAVNASFRAAAADAPLAMEHVMASARREYAKLERLVTTNEFGSWA